MISFICEILKSINEYVYAKQKQTHKQNHRLVVPKGQGKQGRANQGHGINR